MIKLWENILLENIYDISSIGGFITKIKFPINYFTQDLFL